MLKFFLSLLSGIPGSYSMTRALGAFIIVDIMLTWTAKCIAADAWLAMDVNTAGLLGATLAALVGRGFVSTKEPKPEEDPNAKSEPGAPVDPVRLHGADPDLGPGGDGLR